MIKFYIVSTIICLLVSLVTIKALVNKLKREGYKSDEKSSMVEFVHRLLPMFIPLFNIFLALFIVFGADKVYKELIKSGAVSK